MPSICPRSAGAVRRRVTKHSLTWAFFPGLHVQVCVEMLQIHEVHELGRGEEQLQDAAEGEPAGGGGVKS